MNDPIHTYRFIKDIIDAKKDQIVGLAVPNGDRLTLAKGKSKYAYLVSLLLIMGPYHFINNALITALHKIKLKLSEYGLISDPSILGYAKKMGIPVKRIKTPNNNEFREYLNSLDLDIIINQSQSFIKKELLEIPRIGVLNRHNALLPKNRGRLTPFWVLYNKEKETGVSIHFVEESLDSGEIIVQKRFEVTSKDTFNTLVKKNYSIASKAMIEALNKLENGDNDFIHNDDNRASYNSTPLFQDAFAFRFGIKNTRKQ
jgi:folate-dependent phosphoribosylglycinamide formyltransferase PurN